MKLKILWLCLSVGWLVVDIYTSSDTIFHRWLIAGWGINVGLYLKSILVEVQA